MALAYGGILYSDISFQKAVVFLPAILFWLIASASLGHLINDYFDRETDALAEKKNVLEGVAPRKIKLLIVIAIILSLLPTLIFARKIESLLYVVCQAQLFFLYSSSPFRLKTKPFGGILSDALYAHVLPAMVIFNALGVAPISVCFTVVVLFWLVAQGLRNILLHQAGDYLNDVASNTQTFAIVYGNKTVYGLVNYILLPVELICLLCALCFPDYCYLVAAIFFFWLVKWYAEKYAWRSTLQFAKQPHASLSFMNNMYEEWLPLMFLILLVLYNFQFSLVLAGHLLLFRTPVFNLFKLFSDIVQHVFNRK